MITPDDNGYGRVKAWREKNRALVNLKQREYRRKRKGKVSVPQERSPAPKSSLGTDESKSETREIEELREMIRVEHEKPVRPHVIQQVYRDRFTGAVISEAQWKRQRAKDEKAKEVGYVIDEYSQ